MALPFQYKKFSNEGSSSPFLACIFMGMIELRNTFLEMDFDERRDLDSKDKFDKYFRPMYEAALATRDGAREVLWLINTHNFNVTNGKVTRIHENSNEILETIDIPLGQAIDKVITQGTFAIKTDLQTILFEVFNLAIGFVLQKVSRFNNGIADIRKAGKNDFADYLVAVRNKWLSDLLELRNQQEHHE